MSVVEVQRKMLDLISLPRTSLATFDGNPLEYWSFINAFDCCVGRTSVDDGAKLHRLLEYCKGKAEKMLRPCSLMTPDIGYVKARQLLKDRFGNYHKISEAWVRKVTEGGPIKPNSSDALQDLADDVRGCIEALRAMNKIDDIDSRGGMLKILSRMPMYLQSRWRRNAVDMLDRTGSYPNIEEFAKFLERVAREMNDPVFGVVQYHEKTKTSNRNKGSSFHVQASSLNGSERSGGVRAKEFSSGKQNNAQGEHKGRTNYVLPRCYVCSGDHGIRNCTRFVAMSGQKRLEFLKANRLWFNCLETRNHSARWCGKQSNCNRAGCTSKHSKLIHDALQSGASKHSKQDIHGVDGPQVVANSMACGDLSSRDKVALPILPVWVRGCGEVNYTRALALLDSGSNRTFCAPALASKLGLKGIETKLSLETLTDAGGKKIGVKEISLQVIGCSGKSSKRSLVQLSRVYVTENFPCTEHSVDSSDEIQDLDLGALDTVRCL
jgi:hypothetical protein